MKLEQAARSALEALVDHGTAYLHHEIHYSEAITALREALDHPEREWPSGGESEQAELCPLCGDGKLYEHTMYRCKGCGSELADARLMDKNKALAEQAEQEPVGWYKPSDFVLYRTKPDDVFVYIPLYAAPVRTKDLTDDEIYKLADDVDWAAGAYLGFARTVIAADRSKNKWHKN